jgi:hydroxymethylpyrimidine pyrophosphatase-like HAD family hydrolase
MFHVGFRGIVVGNAQPELRALVEPHIYHATAPFAAGVLEGLDYWLQAPLIRPD